MSEASYPGEDLLRGKSPREILKRLVDGDPLELRARCRERVETSALLLDLGRVHLRAVARVARAAPRWRGDPPLAEWITERIEFSMRELIDEDQEAERSGIPPEEPEDARYAHLSEVLGIEPALVRRACVAFNRLPREIRSAWFAVFVLGKTVNRHVAEGNGTPTAVLGRIETAVQTISDAIGRQLDRSPLLRVPRPVPVQSLFERDSRIGSTSSALSNAEHHRVRMRHELARLLRQACLFKLIEGPKSRLYVSRYVDSQRTVQLVAPDDLKRSAEQLWKEILPRKETSSGLRLLQRWAADPLNNEPSLTALAVAAFRLEPTDEARLIAAWDQVQRGRVQTAVRICLDVLSGSPERVKRGRCLEYLSLAYTRLKDFGRALEARTLACSAIPEDPGVEMNRVILGFQCGDREAVLDSSRRLAEMVDERHPLLDWFVSVNSIRRSQREWSPTREGKALANSIFKELGPAGRRIADVVR